MKNSAFLGGRGYVLVVLVIAGCNCLECKSHTSACKPIDLDLDFTGVFPDIEVVSSDDGGVGGARVPDCTLCRPDECGVVRADPCGRISCECPGTETCAAQRCRMFAPVLRYSDLESGPRTGWHDAEAAGAAVTIWGRWFGHRRGDSFVMVGGANLIEAEQYLEWSSDDEGNGRITFLVPSSAAEGPGTITVTVAGIESNSLAFIVRAGRLRWVSPFGRDSAEGSWFEPWQSLGNAIDRAIPGDVIYVEEGLATVASAGTTALDLRTSGTAEEPIALVGLVSARIEIGAVDTDRAIGTQLPDGRQAEHWVLSRLSMVTAGSCVDANSGFRIVANEFSGPAERGDAACIRVSGKGVRVLGNTFTLGSAGTPPAYSVIRATGAKSNDGVEPPAEGDREIAWNELRGNLTNGGIVIENDDPRGARISDHRVHDNLIVDQYGDGIALGLGVVGENFVYNNIVLRAGRGPDRGEGPTSHVGLRLTSSEVATLHVYFNTIVECGSEVASVGNGQILLGDADVRLHNNVIAAPSVSLRLIADSSRDLEPGDWRNLWDGRETPPWDTSAITGSPTFVSVEDDLHLRSSSAAIGAARPLDVWIPYDQDGIARPHGEGADLGAFAYVP